MPSVVAVSVIERSTYRDDCAVRRQRHRSPRFVACGFADDVGSQLVALRCRQDEHRPDAQRRNHRCQRNYKTSRPPHPLNATRFRTVWKTLSDWVRRLNTGPGEPMSQSWLSTWLPEGVDRHAADRTPLKFQWGISRIPFRLAWCGSQRLPDGCVHTDSLVCSHSARPARPFYQERATRRSRHR